MVVTLGLLHLRPTIARAWTPHAPARHPGSPGRWGRESIVEALRRWAAETGGTPRRHDWSGERPHAAKPSQRKWMREHPRWPSSSCVAHHFGTWSKALQAADLPARCLTFEDSIPDRVEAAWRLSSQGHPLREIAHQLGVSVSSVNNYLRARSCPECGPTAPTIKRRYGSIERAWDVLGPVPAAPGMNATT